MSCSKTKEFEISNDPRTQHALCLRKSVYIIERPIISVTKESMKTYNKKTVKTADIISCSIGPTRICRMDSKDLCSNLYRLYNFWRDLLTFQPRFSGT
jgi:hypothetical protein